MAETSAGSWSDATPSAQPLRRPPRDPSAEPFKFDGRQVAWLPGEHPAQLAMKAAAASQANQIDVARPMKGALAPPATPTVGSDSWGRVPQPALEGATPIEVHTQWAAAKWSATEPAARASLSRRWGRPISESEAWSVPAVAAAVHEESSEPAVQSAASKAADRAVPLGRVVRGWLDAAGVKPGTEFTFR